MIVEVALTPLKQQILTHLHVVRAEFFAFALKGSSLPFFRKQIVEKQRNHLYHSA
ncbi:hypothetical protein FLK61_25140 [Paenalkalicoccus suaedae]|uniref:Uncharacterized protein n=1 Tax=Paenalkalicoccus suaedae TaxID=2592382 RepID=A0A859FBJ0_9BACI|nr:RAxF-45 family protein [Paenalkalicoccus suaedae]QKS70061.1 hypothetical protein FLK61_25140 [Paenalkalicoccus suaedae]